MNSHDDLKQRSQIPTIAPRACHPEQHREPTAPDRSPHSLNVAATAPAAKEERLNNLDQTLVAPDSWQVYHPYRTSLEQVNASTLGTAILEVQEWLKVWVLVGRTPFIHSQTYRDQMPQCLQDAYTACATYYASTKDTKGIALQIIEDFVGRLLDDMAIEDVESLSPSCVLVLHLARVQAMLVYQTIRLFDGDIRQRALAEEQAPTLKNWNEAMLTCALRSSQFIQSINRNRNLGDFAAWQAWILAESCRRTWVVSSVVQCTYYILKGGSAYCPGHIMFTARTGLWAAETCFAWVEAQQDKDPLFYNDANGGDIMAQATIKDVDEFALWALKVSTSPGTVESWSSVHK
ncbi:uncharacterized protein HMPREF1541_00087 [Cyphellophora europaea CBS 101466]|uniref:Transcription factor domain-containing protein n=1 Tax=Cyphellophora europaea (strain CBS 101466) TaxID=1220924 RepID=W2SB15_CYPE1|nr:uncharacterized protein HMPREF1541_00087 [Cyphellophora europaea CBS 101466]ETN45906.1 hypothetical protein HMPREF1541_00087 [Cyphellophora europaea CBS 101466]